jgi:hypothetical protein
MNEKAKPNLKSTLVDIILASSIHGLPGVFRTRKLFFKFVWAISFLLSSAACVYMLINSFVEYFDFDFVTTTTIKKEMPATFPKITICNNNPLLTDEGKKYVEETFKEWNITDKDYFELYNPNERTTNEMSITYASMNIYMTKLAVIASAQNRNYSNEFRKSLGLNMNDMLISCFFALDECSQKDFEWYFDTVHGNCYNFVKRDNLKVTKEGMLNGLRLELFVGEAFSIKNLVFANGVTLFINNQTIVPSPFDGYDIPTGKQTNLHLDKLRIEKAFKPYGECTANLDRENSFDSETYRNTFKNYDYYRQKECFNICFQEAIIQYLDCFSTLFPYKSSIIKQCTKRKEIISVFQWFRYYYGNISNKCLEECPLECESEKYTFLVTSLDYPTKVYADLIGKDEVIMKRYGNRTPTFDQLKESILKLNINYQELQYTLVKESQKTTWLDLLSNVGGTLGLFTGFSFLSLVEVLEIIFEILHIKLKSSFCMKSKRQNTFIKVSPRI